MICGSWGLWLFSFWSLLPLFSFVFNFISAAVVQLKALAGTHSAGESLSKFIVEKIGVLQKLLVYVVSITCSFIEINSKICEKAHVYGTTSECSETSSSSLSLHSYQSVRLLWHQKAVVSVMEAGGLNWLVGKVRICSCFFLPIIECFLDWATVRHIST